jgi:hypothetical protein
MGQVDVWHGSPHTFDRFSMEKIGTGEGHQAFGHGLYFTDLVDVAKHYAQMPKKKNVLHINGLEQEDSHAARIVKDVIKRVGPKKHLILHQLKNGLRTIEETPLNNKDAYIKYQKEAIKIAESGDKFEIKDYANLYKATLHKGKNPSEYTYLDWDKPVGQRRADKIIKQAEKEGLDEDDIFDLKEALGTQDSNYPGEPGTGESLYRLIADTFAVRTGENLHGKQGESFNSQKEASLFLKRAGIDGIRYPQGSLSGGGGQGKNYVVFDENAITIEERKALGR